MTRKSVLKNAAICAAMVYMSLFVAWILGILDLPQSEARVLGEAFHRTAKIISPGTYQPPSKVLVVDIDPRFAAHMNGLANIERDWPVAYFGVADVLTAVREVLSPRAVFLDLYFPTVRGMHCPPGTTAPCDREGWQELLQALCAFGGDACAPTSPGGFGCASQSWPARAVPVVIGRVGPTSPHGVAAPGAQTAMRALGDLVSSCAHLSFASLTIGPRFSQQDTYTIASGSDDEGWIRKPAVSLIEQTCLAGRAPEDLDCPGMLRQFSHLQARRAGYGLYWKPELAPFGDSLWRCAVTSNRVRIVASVNRKRDRQSCHRPVPSVPASGLEAAFKSPTATFTTLAASARPLNRYVLIGAGPDTRMDTYVSPLTGTLLSGVYVHATVLETLLSRKQRSLATVPALFAPFPSWVFRWIVHPAIAIAVLMTAHLCFVHLETRMSRRRRQWPPWLQDLSAPAFDLVKIGLVMIVFWGIFALILRWSPHEWASISFFSLALTAMAIWKRRP